MTLWTNPDTLPLAFLSDGDIAAALVGANPFERLNCLYSNLLGDYTELVAPVFAQVTASDSTQSVFQLIGTGKPVCVCLPSGGFQAVAVNDIWSVELRNDETSCVYYLALPARERFGRLRSATPPAGLGNCESVIWTWSAPPRTG